MTIVITKGYKGATDAYNLTRHKDQNGTYVTLRKNKLPRGSVWHRLHSVEHRAISPSLMKAVEEAYELLNS